MIRTKKDLRARKREILSEIDELCKELREVSLEIGCCPEAKRLVGKTVLIKRGVKYAGKKAVVIGPRGSSNSPLYWWIRLLDDGKQVYKQETSLIILEDESKKDEPKKRSAA